MSAIWMGWLKRESGRTGYACMGDRGRAWGLYQFDYRYALVDFLNFCLEKDPAKYADLKPYAAAGKGSSALIGNEGLLAAWTAHVTDQEFCDLQDEYARKAYYEPAAKYLWNLYGIDAEKHSAALRGSLFSFSIRSGQLTGARKFSGGGATEEELLKNAYAKYGNEDAGRWPQQLADALAALEKEMAGISKREAYVEAFKSFEGCNEGDGSHKAIIDLYNTYLPHPRGYVVAYTDAWCAAAASAAAIKAGVAAIFPVECGCEEMINLAKAAGIWIEDDNHVPILAELMMYDWDDDGAGDCTGHAEHVGAVIAIEGKTIIVIEGNKSDAVGYRRIDVGSRFIRGYISPRYEELDMIEKEYEALVPGSTGERVKWWQDGLLALGFADCSFYLPESNFNNGYYGGHTKNFTARFQKYYGLTIDGCAGPESQQTMERELAKINLTEFNFTADQLIENGRKILKICRDGGYVWGSADIAPWLQPEINKCACDRGQDWSFHGLLELGNREAKGISARLLELGAEKITDPDALQAGDVAFFENWHICLIASSKDANGNYLRIDFGSTERMQRGEPSWEPVVKLRHACRPHYLKASPEEPEKPAEKYSLTIEEVKHGSKGPSVRILQCQLKALNYYVGRIDDDFGDLTETALREYQADMIAEGKQIGGADGQPDGVCGGGSWSCLLGIPVTVVK